MRLMGIDYGSKRVGIALSDDGGAMAFPHRVVENTSQLVETVRDVVLTEHVGTIVVGASINREGGANAIQRDVEAFVESLAAAVAVPIVFEGERYTTQEALRIQGRTAHTDASAAALILDSYITRQKNHT